MSGLKDLLAIVRGLQRVADASVKVKEKQIRYILDNSDYRTFVQDVLKSAAALAKKQAEQERKDAQKKSANITNPISDAADRVATVIHGIKEYAQYTSDTNKTDFPQNLYQSSPLDQFSLKRGHVVKKYKNTRDHSQEVEIQLTESDKQLLKKLDMEHRAKLRKKGQFTDEDSSDDDHKPQAATSSNSKGLKTKPNPKSKQKLSESSKQRTVPSSRLGRMVSFGTLFAGLGIGTAAEYVRRSIGMAEDADNPFLTPANLDRIVDTLCKVRGAALKLGQLLSIQDESVVSPQMSKAFERVRKSADFMPDWQVEKVLRTELGDDWRNHFKAFDIKPFAAASIGQVHWGQLPDGREIAIKIQYPGVARGINSDIDNLAGIMKLWNIFPKGMFLDNLMTVAKRELAWEVDYIREAECTRKFKELLKPYDDFFVPDVIDHLSTKQVFTTELIQGVPVDQCFDMDEEHRHFIADRIMELCLLEILEFGYMQTDPNWANFFYNPETKKILLLDFGASREYSKQFLDKYVQILKAAYDEDRDKVLEVSKEIGFFTGYESKIMEDAHVDAVMILGEIFRHPGEFDFKAHDMIERLQNLVPTMITHRLCPPPEEIYSLHRKLSGIFFLCSKLKTGVACRQKFLRLYNNYKFENEALNMRNI